ncbi:GLUG motif-containing protein [Sphaerochaeta sp.]|uniref:GLUG motif-containing protein n=1 Tax=Sphaerochaeta sp. TaxID=1972642 RepID=UPI00258F751E|nr:GLUG motif-containing protein [Sphaerochaeta sp.]MDD3456858.1 GLUG motif-containing protein [Sphaerochaeta sp.]
MDDPLSVGFSGMPDSVEAGDTVTLTSTGLYSGNVQYRWYVNGVRQTDQTASSFSHTFNAAGTHMVSLLVLDGGALGGYGRSIVIEGGVAQPTVLSISVKTPPTKIEYVLGEDLDLSNLMLTASYTDTTESNVSWGLEGLTAEPTHGTPLTEAGTMVVTVFYGGKSSTFTVNVGPSYTGIGTLADPYIAYTAVGLDTIRRMISGEDGGSNQLNAVIHLGADIDLNDIDSIGDNWIPLGNTTLPFRGTFDGNGHTISNLRINRPTDDYVGFFGAQSGVISGVIRDVQLVNVQICGKSDVGSLAGFSSGAIDNCHSAGTVSGNYQYVGGLLGGVSGSVDNCSFTGSVSGLSNWVGGLVGASTGSISHSSASGSVEGTYSTGGLVGRTVATSGSINYCYSQMNVHGLWGVGGLVGHAYGGSWIEYCYATGSVNGIEDYIGGLVGHLESSSLINSSYALGSVTGRGYVGGIVGRTSGNVSNCYATGDVSGRADFIGGLAGFIENSLITDSFAANNVLVRDSSSSNSRFHRITAHSHFGGLNNNYANSEMILPSGIVANASHNGVDGEDATLSQFKSSDYFSDTATWSDAATWNDAQIWVLSDGDFPHLAWE